MATSEEYLDSLLRAVVEGKPKPATVPEEAGSADVTVPEKPVAPEENTVGNISEENLSGDSPGENVSADFIVPEESPTAVEVELPEPEPKIPAPRKAITPEELADMVDRLDDSEGADLLEEDGFPEEYDTVEATGAPKEYSIPEEYNLVGETGTTEEDDILNPEAEAPDTPEEYAKLNPAAEATGTPEEYTKLNPAAEAPDTPEEYAKLDTVTEAPGTSEEYDLFDSSEEAGALPEEYNIPEETDLPDEPDWQDAAGEPEDAAFLKALTDTDPTGEKRLSPNDLEDIFAEMHAHLGTNEDTDNADNADPTAGTNSADNTTADAELPADADLSSADTPDADTLTDSLPELDDLATAIPEPADPDFPAEAPQSLDDLLAADDFTEDDELSALLNDPEISAAGLDDEIPPEADGTNPEDMEIGDLLAGMGDDEDLSEIRGLLDKADSNELVEDEDMLALLDGMSEYGGKNEEEDKDDIMTLLKNDESGGSTDQDNKKKKKGSAGKKKGAGNKEEQEIDLSELDGIMRNGGKKKGFFGRLFSALTDSDEEPEAGSELQSITDENQAVLNELAVEDKKDAKGKKAKGKKKKGKGKEASDGEDIPEKGGRGGRGGDDEEAPGGKKKKPKKEKPKKEKKKPEIIEPIKREKKVSPKKIMLVIVFCASLTAAIFTLCSILPDYEEREEARKAYLNEDYKTVYQTFYGKKLSKGDTLLLNQSSVILQMNRKLEAYQNYQEMGMPAEALHALLQGVVRYESLIAEDLYEVQDKVSAVYQMILDVLASDFGISEADAQEIVVLDEAAYGERIASIVFGSDYGSPAVTPEAAGDNMPVTDANEPVTSDTNELTDPLAADVSAPDALTEENSLSSDGSAEEGEIIP